MRKFIPVFVLFILFQGCERIPRDEEKVKLQIINNITLMPDGFYSTGLGMNVISLNGSLWYIKPQFYKGNLAEQDSRVKASNSIDIIPAGESSEIIEVEPIYTRVEFQIRLISKELAYRSGNNTDLCIAQEHYVIVQNPTLEKGGINTLTVNNQTQVAIRYDEHTLGTVITIDQLIEKYKDALTGQGVTYCDLTY